jgi:hypothetical protein
LWLNNVAGSGRFCVTVLELQLYAAGLYAPLTVDETGNSEISMEDFAVALVDETQAAKFPRAAFTVGY